MPILCYHSVSDAWDSPLAVAVDRFRWQCRRLAQRYEPVDVTTALSVMDRQGRLPGRMVTVTLDDGFCDNYEPALPILREHSIPATVFVVAATLDRGMEVNWIDDPPSFPLTTLNRAQLLEMADMGVTVGSHSLLHRDLTALSHAECLSDLIESREIVEEALGLAVPYLAYPRGRLNPMVADAAQRAGYSHGFSLPTGPEAIYQYSIPRVGIYRHNSRLQFVAKTTRRFLGMRMSPGYARLRQR